ncbi:SsgA family sporulation/cell division regulator [Streptomyces sp. E11-3]|uniref:SsgA family sporulation/cell division regulator n=1 Tax=Streptomyces sp. E11-3 TaxID=3110112 RepID=UPI0039815E60
MKREDLTCEDVVRAIVRIRQAAQGPASGRFRACLQELADLQERLAQGETPDLDSYPEGLAALDFVGQLERSSLGTPAAEGMRARTSPAALRRIARHQQQLNADETEDQPRDEDVTHTEPHDATPLRYRMLARLTGPLKPLHWGKPARGAEAGRGSNWSVRTDRESEIPEVICEVQLRLQVSEGSPLPVPAEFRYRPTDPYAIKVIFHTGSDEHVSWVFARETITAGLRTHSGAGDVKIWPRSGLDTKAILISLESHEGTAVMEAPRAALQTFLRRTNGLVPLGSESQHVDIDKAFDPATFQAKEGHPQTRADQ